jgi:mannosyl-oligosaccharide alpha-1,2-mannosidase
VLRRAYLTQLETRIANIVMFNLRRTAPWRRAARKRFVVLAAALFSLWLFADVLFPSAPRRPDWADRAVTPTQRANAVRDVFKFAWKGYYQNAFPNDELIPVWNSYSNSR